MNEENQKLFAEFAACFSQMGIIIKKLPFSDQIKSIVLREFDDGFLWAKEGFQHLQAQALMAQSAPSEPSIMEAAQAETAA